MAVYPVLYSFRRCPYAMRARSAIAISSQACELREVVLRNKPAALLQVSAKGTVPVLVVRDGLVIEQSLDIMLWALQQNDPAHWLDPTLQDIHAMLALIAECDGQFKHHLDRYKYPQRYGNENGDEHRAQAGQWINTLEARLCDAPYLFGAHAALADMAIAPFVRQFAHTDLDWFQAQRWPKVQGWLQAWCDSDLFDCIMTKYAPWEPGAPAVRFPA